MTFSELGDLIIPLAAYKWMIDPVIWFDTYRSPATDKPVPKGTPCDYLAKLAPS